MQFIEKTLQSNKHGHTLISKGKNMLRNISTTSFHTRIETKRDAYASLLWHV